MYLIIQQPLYNICVGDFLRQWGEINLLTILVINTREFAAGRLN